LSKSSCYARPDHTLGHFRPITDQSCLPVHVRFAPKANLRLGATGRRRSPAASGLFVERIRGVDGSGSRFAVRHQATADLLLTVGPPALGLRPPGVGLDRPRPPTRLRHCCENLFGRNFRGLRCRDRVIYPGVYLQVQPLPVHIFCALGRLAGTKIMNWGLYSILYIGVVVTFWFVLGLAFIGLQTFIWALMYLIANRKTVLSALYTVLLYYLYLILLAIPLLAMYLLTRLFLGSFNFSENQILRISAIICLVLGVWLSPKIKRTIYKWTGIGCCSPRTTGHGHGLPRASINSRGERYPRALCG
jgi:hypothetical protein